MNTFRKLAVILSLVVVSALMVAPTFAATTTTKVITRTEDQINSAYYVTNPAWRAVSDRYVDLQAGQIVVQETVTLRGKDPMAVVVIYTPYIENERLLWTVASVTHDGQAASQEIVNQINANRSYSWRNYWKRNGVPGKVQSVVITDSDITVTVVR